MAPAMVATIITGQISLLLLLPFTLAWYRVRRGRDAEAGFWLGLCAGTKPFFFLHLVWLAATRRWRAAACMLGAVAAFYAAGLAVFGVTAYREWYGALESVSWAEHYMNASLLGLIERTLSRSDWPYQPLLELPSLVRPLWIVSLAAVVWRGLSALARPLSLDRQFLIVTSAMLLISPLGWVYYLFLLMPPLAAVLASETPMLERHTRVLMLVGVGFLLVPAPVPWLTLQWDNGLITATLGGVYTWGLLIVFLAATRVEHGRRGHEGAT
jgi:alpha-1,2-mannosyltransferase